MNIPTNWFLAVNIMVAAIVLFCVIKGFVDGFLFGTISLVFFLISGIAAWFIAPILSARITLVNLSFDQIPFIDLSSVNAIANTAVWFVIIFIVLNLVYLVIKPLLKKISKLPVIGFANRLLGGCMGLIYGYLIVVLLTLLLSTPVFKNGAEIKQGTILKYTDTISQQVTKLVVKNIDIKKVKIDIDDSAIQDARNSFEEWLISIGVLDE